MKLIRAIPIVLVLTLGACSYNPLTPITNPVSTTNLYQAELVFDASLKTFNALKGLCIRRVLPPVCRTYVIKGQGIIRQASAADIAARNFIKNNPTLDASNVVQAFSGIVSNFKSTLDSLSATKS